MTKKLHPADIADRAAVESAKSFNVHVRLSPKEKYNEPAATIAEAITKANELRAKHGKEPMIYAVTDKNTTHLVPADMLAGSAGEIPAFLKRDAATPAPAPAVKKKPPVKKAKPAAVKAATAKLPRAAVLEAAEKGKLPSPPDFSAATHARYRTKLEEVVALAKEGNVKALKAYKINPVSSSPKAIDRYRKLALIALEARG